MPTQEQAASPVTLLRPDDLLLLRFHFNGLKLQRLNTNEPWTLVPDEPNQTTPLIVVEFPPQSIGEEAFFEDAGISPPTGEPPDPPPGQPDPPADFLETPKPPGKVDAFLSGPTWLVFNVANETSIPYSLEGIIAACVNGDQIVSDQRKEPPERLHSLSEYLALGRLFSRIEAPYRLVLSPEVNTTWWGRVKSKPNAAGTRVELWHASMIRSRPTPANKRPPHGGKLRAVWATDFADFSSQPWPADPPDHAHDPFRMSLDKRDRYELVRLTTDAGAYAQPVEAEQLILSTMGAWLKAAGAWTELPNDLSVTEWKHLMTMGRDHFVRVVYQGFLFPLGHAASLVKITERKIENVPGQSKRAAYLRTRMFVIVRQPTLDYSHNGFPFTQVTLKTLVTPSIAKPEDSQIANPSAGPLAGFSQDAFWIRASDQYVQFRIAAVDHEGRTVEFTAPLAFVSNDKATGDQTSTTIVTNAWSAPNAPTRACTLGGQAVAFAPHALPNDTTLETQSINLGAEPKKINDAAKPLFRPTVTEAQVDIPAVKQLLGTDAQWSTIAYEATFTSAEPGQFQNPAEIFARVTGAPPVTFSTEQAGGLVQPNFAIEGLSRGLGPVPKADDMLKGSFDPKLVFPNIVLLGGIKLNEIVNLVEFTGPPPDGEYVPRLTTTVEQLPGGPPVSVARYRWYLKKNIPDTNEEYRGGLFDTGLFAPDLDAEFEIVSEVRRPLDGSPGSFLSMGRLTNFGIVLMPEVELVKLHFGKLEFTARSGQKTDVVVALSSDQAITFLGPLRFVNKLMQVVPLDGFSDPPYLNIDANGVRLGYTLALPNVGIGVFSLQNLSLSAEFRLPFIGEPVSVSLGFCSRENPGQVLVSLFGGGVFFGITLDMKGVQLVEMALEFGAGISLNLGVASGSVTVMGGVYFQKSGAGVLLSAYIRMIGKLRVLGLISVTVEFYLALEYLVSDDKLFGIAQLKVKVKIAFFSKTVSLEVRREFKGSDPTFREMLALPDWQAYCDAYGD